MFNFKKLTSVLTFGAVTFATSAGAHALPSPIVTKPGKLSAPIRSGALIGGKANLEFSLLSVAAKPVGTGERITLAYGDLTGKPLEGEPGFFHAVIDRESKRIVIDLAQVGKTRVDANALRKAFANSRFVASTDITMDPHDGSTNITLELKTPVNLLATTDPRKNSRIVFELRPSAVTKK